MADWRNELSGILGGKARATRAEQENAVFEAFLDATAMPAPVGLAATFDVEAARLYGTVMGRDAKALGQDILLAPHINIVRDPLFRRNHTTFSEDPLLTAQLAAYMRQFSDIPFASDVAELLHSREVFEDLLQGQQMTPEDLRWYAPIFEVRYKSVTEAIRRTGSHQVLELASGLTMRGLAFTQDPRYTYIESDLTGISAKKKAIIASKIYPISNSKAPTQSPRDDSFRAKNPTNARSSISIPIISHVFNSRRKFSVRIVCKTFA